MNIMDVKWQDIESIKVVIKYLCPRKKWCENRNLNREAVAEVDAKYLHIWHSCNSGSVHANIEPCPVCGGRHSVEIAEDGY